MLRYISLSIGISFAMTAVPSFAQDAAETTAEYRKQAQAELQERRAAAQRPDHARNVIIFIGDGMGVSTLAPARILAGETAEANGEAFVTGMDRLDHTALIKTYSHDHQVSDSAATATAIMAGIKTRNSVIGLGPEARVNDCASGSASQVPSLFGLAQDSGRATGIVTTTRITHATPAATYAHTPQRNWEADAAMPKEALDQGCLDIARQLVEGAVGSKFDLILGGGRSTFLPETAKDPEYPDRAGSRKDGRDLIAQWRAANSQGNFVWNAAQFGAIDPADGQKLLGLFEPDHMRYEADRKADAGGEPSLAEMTELAIRRLSQSGNGYVLLIEGGRIDHAHHAGNAYRALTDAMALDEAVSRAFSLVDLDDTLIITTADHSHTLTMSGYPRRGNPILGTVASDKPTLARDGKAYTTLGYANGPGAVQTGERPDPAHQDTAAPDYLQQSLIPLGSETHGGEDVLVRASGPGAQLFRGTMEQHTIFYIVQETLLGADAAPSAADAPE